MNVDDLLLRISDLQDTIEHLEERLRRIEEHYVTTRDLDRVEANLEDSIRSIQNEVRYHDHG